MATPSLRADSAPVTHLRIVDAIADPDLAIDDGPCDEPTQDREPEDGV